MIRNYKLRIYPNKGKAKRLDGLLAFWKSEVQKKINLFWDVGVDKTPFCLSEFRRGGMHINYATQVAYTIVKNCKKSKIDKPTYNGNEVYLHCNGLIYLDYKTKEYDFWIKISGHEKGKGRIVLPCKTFQLFNDMRKFGKLKHSGKLIRKQGKYYLIVYIEIPDVAVTVDNYIGIDVGLKNPVVTSDGKFYGQDIESLRRRTKWRRYNNGLSACKQKLNQLAKQFPEIYPNTNFIVENLSFKGRKKSNRKFRRNKNNWAYNHFSGRLEDIGKLKGFDVVKVNPAYTSQTCPMCGRVSKSNRKGELFQCKSCDYVNHADVVGAMNVLQSRQGSLSTLNPVEIGN